MQAQACAKLFTGAKMPLVGLGTWKSKPGQVTKAVECALDCGYRHIDCAAVYGNEKEVGAAFTAKFGDNLKREDVFVTSKLWNTFHRPEHVKGALMSTLKDLNLKYLDLYLIHWPNAFAGDKGTLFPKNADGSVIYDTSPEAYFTKTWKAMEECVKEGLVKHIGLSNFNIDQIRAIQGCATIMPAVLQVECNPYLQQTELINFCNQWNIVVTAYSPLGSPDRPWAKPDEPYLLQDPKLAELAKKKGKTAAHMCIRYQVERGVVVIPKSVTPARIKANFDVFDFKLDNDDMEYLSSFGTRFRSCVPKITLPNGKSVPRDMAHPDFPWNAEYVEFTAAQ